jgi:hypothetical protein
LPAYVESRNQPAVKKIPAAKVEPGRTCIPDPFVEIAQCESGIPGKRIAGTWRITRRCRFILALCNACHENQRRENYKNLFHFFVFLIDE